MRGKTVKLLNKFAQHLIDNTAENERGDKTKHAIVNELKTHWRKRGVQGQKFIKTILKHNIK